jgi:glycosyltransferase involved in cell wall biosynthesis
MIRVLALVAKPPGLSPGQRYRIEQWEPLLRERHGIDVEYDVFESPALTRVLYHPHHRVRKAALLLGDAWRRRRILSRARGYDAIFIYREASLLGPAIYERLLERQQVPIVYDFDDAVWMTAESRNGIFSSLRFPSKTADICRLATAVTVGNRYLADYAGEYNRNVDIVPTTIDLARYPVQPELTAGRPIVIGWTGSFSTLNHLEMARGAIERFARHHDVVVRVICSEPPRRPFANAQTDFVPWRADSEAHDVGRAHFGIMPLPNDAFARGKCGCKALQYMATGRPVVISPVGINAEIVTTGQNGILADSEDQWVAAFEQLSSSPAERARLGAAARRTVELRFSAEQAAERFAAVIHRVVQGADAKCAASSAQ